MTRDEMEELKGLAASMGFYDDKNPCKRAVILGKAIKALEQQTCEDAISRKAAIAETYRDCTYVKSDKDAYEQLQCIRDGINKLPSVQPKPTECEDAVSREAVLDLFAKNCDAVRPYSKTWEEVKALPSVNPQRTGHWIEEDRYIDRYDDTIEILQCSLCGFKHHYAQGDTSKTDSTWYNYCPNCGSGMVEPQESEDKE